MKKAALLLTQFALFVFACSTPEKPDQLVASLDSIVTAVADTGKFNGNILFARNGKVIYQKSVGWANYDTKEPLNDSTLFELASVSKQFTAMGIMMLKEQGKLSYDDDVRKYIPDLPYEGMTIRHFLTHTSGIPEYEVLFEKENWDQQKIAHNEDIIAILVKLKPPILFKPGEKWEYSNTAYALLATIIGRASGKPYGEFLKENIFKPVGMTRTRTYITRRAGERIPNYAFGFVYNDSLDNYFLPDSLDELHFVYTLDGIEGDGTVNSTTSDLFKWNEVLYTDKLVSRGTLEEAFAPLVPLNDGTDQSYGFGWFVRSDSTLGHIVQHSGSWPGYGTFIFRYLDRRDCLIILTNNGGFSRRLIAKEVEERMRRQQTQ